MKQVYKSQHKGLIQCNEAYFAESIEERMRKVMKGADQIENTSDIIFTERKDGVLPQYDIRTDRFEVAQEAADKVHATIAAQRQARIEEANKQNNNETTYVTE